ADEVLLGNPDFDNLFRQRFAKWPKLSRAARIACHGNYVSISLREREQRVGKLIEIRPTHFQAEFFRRALRGVAEKRSSGCAHTETFSAFSSSASAASISVRACAYSSSLGTPWCHLPTCSI